MLGNHEQQAGAELCQAQATLTLKSTSQVQKVWKSEEVVKTHEQVEKKSGIIYEQVMNKLWTGHEQVKNKSWKSHEKVMNM